MKKIPLPGGKFATVDDEDYEWLSQWKWHVRIKPTNKYAARNNHGGTPTTIQMHRQILGAKKGQLCDHINGNGLDNRRSNIRLCTPTESNRHVRKRSHNKSGYLGVYWHKNRWNVTIRVPE